MPMQLFQQVMGQLLHVVLEGVMRRIQSLEVQCVHATRSRISCRTSRARRRAPGSLRRRIGAAHTADVSTRGRTDKARRRCRRNSAQRVGARPYVRTYVALQDIGETETHKLLTILPRLTSVQDLVEGHGAAKVGR
jgi:hypothetical protein